MTAIVGMVSPPVRAFLDVVVITASLAILLHPSFTSALGEIIIRTPALELSGVWRAAALDPVSTGSSAALPGGTVQAKIHLDGLISRPTIWLDDEMIMKDGAFVVDFA